MLHDVEGYKHREIAAMLDIATGTSKRQLHRARMLMRKHSGWIMTMHEEWTDKLSDYLDDELAADEQRRGRVAPAGMRARAPPC